MSSAKRQVRETTWEIRKMLPEDIRSTHVGKASQAVRSMGQLVEVAGKVAEVIATQPEKFVRTGDRK